MSSWWSALGVCCGMLLLAGPQDLPPAAPPPAWYLEHVTNMTRDGGRWIADNSDYLSDRETDDAYGVEWIAAPGGAAMCGRLFGLREGQETREYWRFMDYWDPETRKVVSSQFGRGRVGHGETTNDDGVLVTAQRLRTFHGKTDGIGHRTENPDPDTHIAESFQIDADGEWTPNRNYTWVRQQGD